MATSSSAIQKKIETLKKGLNNKFITAAQKEKIKAQVQKLESQSKASAPKKATKPAASSSLTRLQKLVKNKKYGVYKGAGVDLKKDSDRPAKAIGKRTSKSGKTYYEYRANRIDVKQPPKKYPKLEKGGYMAKGGKVRSQEEFNKLVAEKEKLVKNLSPKEVAEMWNKNSNSPSKMTEEEGKMSNSRMYLADLLVENELTEAEHSKYFEKGGYMAKGGVVGEYKIVPNKRGEGKLRMYVTSDYEMAFKISGSKEEAEKAAQNFVKEHNETHPTATVTKIHSSGQPIKNKNVSYVTKDEISKFEDGGMMNEPKYDSAGFSREDDKRIKIYSGNKGKLNEIFNEYKNQKNELRANEVFDNEKMKGKSVFLFVNDDFYDQYVQDEDEESYADENFGFADGGRVKGRNNETGETYGVVIGSVKKSDENIEGGTEMNVRKGYSSRISEVKLVFDKNANLYEITDYGYALEGNYPDTSRGSGRNYNADKKETLEVLSKKYNPAFAKKLIELANNPKMAEGGMTEHGLRIGDKITTDMFWDNQIVVENTKTNKRAQIDLETGKRKDEMEKGGYMAKGGGIYSSDNLYILKVLKKGQKEVATEKFRAKSLLEAKEIVEDEYEKKYESKFGNELSFVVTEAMADGGVTEKEVVESNADMVLSQIKAVKHHAEELSSVVSRKSNIEAWVVGKIERASTDLSDITHYLEGNKDKMSMGGTVRYYAHKMDKK